MRLIVGLVATALAADNGRAVRPPLGWRSWNLYGAKVNQPLIQSIMDGMVARKRTVDGQVRVTAKKPNNTQTHKKKTTVAYFVV